MPTETQHLEQRVAALQSDLNTRDEQIDALTLSDNDRELSRRDWFEAAQAAEKRVEVLRGDLASANADKEAYAQNAINLRERLERLKDQLAERDALLRECVSVFSTAEASVFETGMRRKIDAALSASAEPSAPTCGHPACKSLGEPHPFCDFVQGLEPSAPIKRDERAEFESVCKQLGYLTTRHHALSDQYKEITMQCMWQTWTARAALDKSTEGASHE